MANPVRRAVFNPDRLVKDAHGGNPQPVLDSKIDEFLEVAGEFHASGTPPPSVIGPVYSISSPMA